MQALPGHNEDHCVYRRSSGDQQDSGAHQPETGTFCIGHERRWHSRTTHRRNISDDSIKARKKWLAIAVRLVGVLGL